MSIRAHAAAVMLAAAAFLAGCPVTQPQNTPVSEFERFEPQTQTWFRLYVPSYYDRGRRWPLVITLHGTFGFDSPAAQIREWKALAEEHGFIVAAPSLLSTQGVLPRIKGLWYQDLARDERTILAVRQHVVRWYSVDPEAVLLTGFSAGGYPMYWTGLRHPEQFSMLVARACNCDLEMLGRIPETAPARQLPVCIYCGRGDLAGLRDQARQAYEYLQAHHFNVTKRVIRGGHSRSPKVAWEIWDPALARR